MTYIIPAAGKGFYLQSDMLKYPKTSYMLDENTTVLQRLVRLIRKYDVNAEIVVIVGYLSQKIMKELEGENCVFIKNPFYEVTNSISSLWFARDYLERENVTIVHGDMVFSEKIIKDYFVKKTDYPYVFGDTSESRSDTYNMIIKDDKVVAVSKDFDNYHARY